MNKMYNKPFYGLSFHFFHYFCFHLELKCMCVCVVTTCDEFEYFPHGSNGRHSYLAGHDASALFKGKTSRKIPIKSEIEEQTRKILIIIFLVALFVVFHSVFCFLSKNFTRSVFIHFASFAIR